LYKINSIDIRFRLEKITILFIFLSTSISFIGEFIFKQLNIYKDRNFLEYNEYFFEFFILTFIIIIGFLIMKKGLNNRLGKLYKKNEVYSDIYTITNITIMLYILFLPFEFYFIMKLVSKGIDYRSLDLALYELYKIPIYSRLFWYSSFLLGLSLIIIKIQKKLKRLILIIISICQFILLVIYGSKALFIFPVISYFITLDHTGLYKFKKKKLIVIFIIIIIIIFISPIYTNLRTSLTVYKSKYYIIDLFATFMPEQRDGAYMISKYGEFYRDKEYITKFINLLFISIFNYKTLAEKILNIDFSTVNKYYIYIIQYNLGYSNFNPRIGLIGHTYVFAGRNICHFVIILFGLFLIFFVYWFYSKIHRMKLYDIYFIILFYLNLLWTYNSNLFIVTPFLFYLFYFYIIFKIFIIVSHKLKKGV